MDDRPSGGLLTYMYVACATWGGVIGFIVGAVVMFLARG